MGWALSNTMKAEDKLLKAWTNARVTRNIQEGFVFASTKVNLLFSHNKKITQSMSKKGNCWDNAVAESFLSLSNMNG